MNTHDSCGFRQKSQCTGNLETLILQLRQNERHVRILGSDQGTEFANRELQKILRDIGVCPLYTNTYTPEENSLEEKMNGVVLRSVRVLLVTSGLPTKRWGEAFKFVVTVRNFSPSKAIQGRTPYELFEGRKPDVSGLRLWGCAATYFVPRQRRKGKQDTTAREALFLGYPESTTGYRVLDLVTGRIVETRDVKFREQWTVRAGYVDQLLEKLYAKESGVVLPVSIPYVKLPLHNYTSSCSSDETALALHSSDEVGPVDAQVGGDVAKEKRAEREGGA
ncbi:hypothetical protein PI125_g20432 [Phytophthora idaei]|nr:hypothetical protein PI125_g20432 [Phytophthora idaei]